MVIAHINSAIEYASSHGIYAPVPTHPKSVESANAEMISESEKLATLCNSAIMQLSILRDMCIETKKAIIGVTDTAKPIDDAPAVTTDGAGVSVTWTTGNYNPPVSGQVIPNLFLWDAVKKAYVFNRSGRDKNAYTEQPPSHDSMSVVLHQNNYIIRWAPNGTIVECVVHHRDSDQIKIACKTTVEPIVWRPDVFHKAFNRDQIAA